VSAFTHVADKADALARNGFDETLRVATVPECLARSIDAAGQVFEASRNAASSPAPKIKPRHLTKPNDYTE
jgi:hypothetical protein